MENCSFCGGVRANKLAKSCHERLCKLNPERAEHPRNMLGKPGRNQYTRAENPQKMVSEDTRAKLIRNGLRRKHSLETREKISFSMKKYFQENPDKAYYVSNHYTNGPSYAETYWAEILKNSGIVFQPEYRIGRFRLDFALTESMIDLEIDGSQHYTSDEARMRDANRDAFLESLGWKVVRIRWSDFKKLDEENKNLFVNGILSQIKSCADIIIG